MSPNRAVVAGNHERYDGESSKTVDGCSQSLIGAMSVKDCRHIEVIPRILRMESASFAEIATSYCENNIPNRSGETNYKEAHVKR